jgi:UDP-N-acetylmuramyl pentapeptide phosphotransferase/UDP-N-acetylglucosamine-1-phosphate transferase
MVAAAAFAAGCVFTPFRRNLAIRWGVLDGPENNRKIHSGPIPRIDTREVLT